MGQIVDAARLNDIHEAMKEAEAVSLPPLQKTFRLVKIKFKRGTCNAEIQHIFYFDRFTKFTAVIKEEFRDKFVIGEDYSLEKIINSIDLWYK
jgi:hypothetical protein